MITPCINVGYSSTNASKLRKSLKFPKRHRQTTEKSTDVLQTCPTRYNYNVPTNNTTVKMKFAAVATVAFAASANAFAPATTGNVSYEVVLCSGDNCRCLMEAQPICKKMGSESNA